MRLLTGSEISNLLRSLTPEDATKLLKTLSAGLAAYSKEKKDDEQTKKIHQPLRTVIQTSDRDTTLVMPVSDTTTTSVKVATVPNKGDIQGAITIYSPVGELLGLLNAAEITAFRTALAVMTILTRWKAPEAPVLAVFGAGKQAEWHIRLALLLIPGVKKVAVLNRSKDRLENFKQTVLTDLRRSHPGVQFYTIARPEVTEATQSALIDADIICCCTPSTKPLFEAEYLQEDSDPKSRFLSLIGSYKPEMQEVDTDTLRLASGKIFVDSKEACLEEAGEFIRAKLGPDDLTEIGELFANETDSQAKTTLNSQSPLTIFKCVGLGIMDLTIARALLEMAETKGVGSVINDF